jgi:imidazolonepropionase-like amidohydrolase
MADIDKARKTHTKIALINVRVFDGNNIREPGTVVIDGEYIGEPDPIDALEVDAKGGILLPGLIDAHIHLHGPENLVELARHGVTTALDMGTWPNTLLDSLREQENMTDIRACGVPATAPGSFHSHIPTLPKEALVSSPVEAMEFVANRVSEGADYIKVIADIPGPDQASLDALVTAAHEQGRIVIAHAVSSAATRMAQDAGADVITHVPLDQVMNEAQVSRMVAAKRFSVPTLAMMEEVAKGRSRDQSDYNCARATVTALYQAGVPILAGTDANAAPGIPANIAHGPSLHHELELLVDAGLSTIDALRAATSLPAEHFNLVDRGVIEIGRRADLVLLSEDPVRDIRATRSIQKVWIAGKEIEL